MEQVFLGDIVGLNGMYSLFYPIPEAGAWGSTYNSHKNPRQNHLFLATTCVFKNPGAKDGGLKRGQGAFSI